MTAKQKYNSWMEKGAENSQDPKSTFLHRVTVKVLSGIILSVLSVIFYFILDVRDNMKKIPSQEKDINYLKRSEEFNRQKFGLILLDNHNRGVPTDYLRPIFQELDYRNDELKKKEEKEEKL